jgi:transcription elongation factor S-II
VRRRQESVQLDWAQKNKRAVLESAGMRASEGSLQCGRCKSKNTDYTQKQTRSADEPMTT